MTIADWYEKVNAEWPSPIPPMTADEAVAAAKRLYRFGMKRTFRGPVRVTSGNRYTWIRRGEMVVNPQHGWHGVIHLLSHYCHSRRHPDERPHSRTHARMELRMIKEVVRRGWLEGKLLRPAQDRAARAAERAAHRRTDDFKLAQLLAREKRWITRTKRAATALRKIRRSIKRLQSKAQPA